MLQTTSTEQRAAGGDRPRSGGVSRCAQGFLMLSAYRAMRGTDHAADASAVNRRANRVSSTMSMIESSFGIDGAVSRDLSIFQYQARVPVMEPHLFPLAVNVIKSG